jgi:hypothetical protein
VDELLGLIGGFFGAGWLYQERIEVLTQRIAAFEEPNKPSKDSPASPGTTVPIQPGTIIVTQYPTGELFAVEPKSGTLRLISARLWQPMGLAIRPNGEIIVLDSEYKAYNLPRSSGNHYPTKILGGNPKRGLTVTLEYISGLPRPVRLP